MPSWWEELIKIPGHADQTEFAQIVHASFEVPKVCNWVKKVDNYHMQPPAYPSIEKHHFLPPKDARFDTQDTHLTQLQHTIAYARALQHWHKEVHPPIPCQPHCLVRSVQEFQWAVELLATFAEGDVFMTTAPSKWIEITLPWLTKGCPPRVPKEPCMKQQGLSKGIPVCDLQQRLA